jgi:DNA-binding transcriptional ArsR family regulator
MPKRKSATISGNGVQVRQQLRQAADLLKQGSDPTRLQLLTMLSGGEMYVGAVCRELNLGQPAVSHHIALLRASGTISPRRQGQNTFYSLTEKGELLASIIEKIAG